MGKRELVDITCEVRKETDKGLAIWDGEEDKDGKEVWTWLPKSEVEVNDDGTITLPEWLAKNKGLI